MPHYTLAINPDRSSLVITCFQYEKNMFGGKHFDNNFNILGTSNFEEIMQEKGLSFERNFPINSVVVRHPPESLMVKKEISGSNLAQVMEQFDSYLNEQISSEFRP